MAIKNFIFLFLIHFSVFAQQTIKFETNNPQAFDVNDFNIKIIPLETNDQSIIGKISSVTFFKNHWYVVDHLTNAVIIFYNSGKFIRKIRKVGEAPGKYSKIGYFTINPYNDHLEIADNYKNTIYIYNLLGKFIAQKRLSFPFISYLHINSNRIAINKQYQIDNDKSYNVLITDRHYKVLKKILPINEYPSSALTLASRFELKRINNKIWWKKSYDPSIYEINNMGIKKIYHLDFGNLWPNHDFAFNHDNSDFNKIYNTFKKKYLMFYDVFNFKNYILAKYTYQHVPFISIYNKNKNFTKLYHCKNMPKYFNDLIGYTDASVITAVNPLSLINSNIPLTDLQKDMIKSYEEEPNPWLIILTYKAE